MTTRYKQTKIFSFIRRWPVGEEKKPSPTTSDTKRKNDNKRRDVADQNVYFLAIYFCFIFFSFLFSVALRIASFISSRNLFARFSSICLIYSHFSLLFEKNEFCNRTGSQWFTQIPSSRFRCPIIFLSGWCEVDVLLLHTTDCTWNLYFYAEQIESFRRISNTIHRLSKYVILIPAIFEDNSNRQIETNFRLAVD